MAVTQDQQSSKSSLREILADLSSASALRHASVGIICGLVGVIFALSYAALLFSGPLGGHIGTGMGIMLFSGAVFAFVSAFLTSFPPIYAQVREVPIAYLALVAPAVATAVAAEQGVLPTVVAMIGASALFLGAAFLLVGQLKLGRFIRFIPFPVISGFLAGVAWLIVAGGLVILTGEPLELASIPDFFDADHLPKLACAVAFMALAILSRRWLRTGLAIPVLVLVAVILFNLVIWIGGISMTELQSTGWLVDLPDQALWPPIEPGDLGAVDWLAILRQAPAIAIIIPVAMVAVLLNVSGLEVDAKRDIDLDRELKTAGIGNIIAGLGGGAPGYQSLSMTTLSRQLGGGTRLTTLVAGFVLLAFLVFGRPLMGLIPLPVFAGVILATGVTLLHERLVLSYRQLPAAEYLILLGIFILTVWLGFVAAVSFGTVAAMALFIFDYSRSAVVKLEVSGSDYQSNAMASDARRQILQRHGDAILIMRLQGYLFFGTANGLRRTIERRIASAPTERPIRFLLLDFRLIYGLDSAAVQSFVRLADTAEQTGVTIIIAHISDEVLRTLRRSGVSLGNDGPMRLAADMDEGLASCEKEILSEVRPDLAAAEPFPIASLLRDILGDEPAARLLAQRLEAIEFQPGETIIRQDSPSDDLLFLEAGVASIRIGTGASEIRLATIGPGAIVGEISFYLGKPRTASVVAEGIVTGWRFTRASLEDLQAQSPDAATRFHRGMAAMLADRLTATNRLVRFLAE